MTPVPGGHALHGNPVARLQRVCAPAALRQINGAVVLDRPVDQLFPTCHVHEYVDVGIGPVHERHDAFERGRFGIVELCQNLVVGHPRRDRQQKSRERQGGADSTEFHRESPTAW